ncbi:MAG TPA: cell division protein FtsK, partial [Clostridiales bacterium]|nr:cell division protein FtsK [Clostridiales bacterium]
MKNNEIMISVKFENKSVAEEISFLVLKDITLKAFIESIYYGLKKVDDYEELFELLNTYLKTRKELQVLYNSKGDFNIIDVSEEIDGKRMLDMKLDELGFVTSSCVLFTMEIKVNPTALFKKLESSYILKGNNSLEYNISTRRLNVIEPSIIDIIPPNEMPQKDKSSILDVIIPTVLSTVGMLGARYLVMMFASSAASMGNTMLLMSGAMGVVALVTSLYNYMKNRSEYKKNVEEWKNNYENYIYRKINTINEWQKSDIKYLNSVYPNMDMLFKNTAEINGVIFSRSQNDNDFMMISLGMSDEVKPLFEIKSEKKDNIFYDIHYKKCGDKIKILLPSKKDEKRRRKLTPDEIAEEDKNKFLLTDLAYNFANKGVDNKDNNEIIGFNYLRGNDGSKPPLLLDLKSCGALGVISSDNQTSQNFIQHIIFELAYYHSPEDLQFVFFFDKEESNAKQNEIIQGYKYLPHANELLDGISQFVFDKD